MRVVLYNVTTGFKSGGIETYNWEIARALSKKGHDVTLVTGCGDRRKFDDISIVKVPFTARQEFWNLGWINRKFGASLRKYLERRSFAKNARTILQDLEPDCVIVFKPYDFGFMRALKRHRPGVIVVFRSGGKDFFYTDFFNRSLVDVWISCSTYNQRQIEKRYKRAVQVIPHGVATDVFKPAERDNGFRKWIGVSESSFVAIGIGRLVKWKGFQTAIEAIAEMENVELVLIGSGGYEGALKEMCFDLGVADRVHFVGEVDNYSIPYYLQQADVYLHPSIGEEAFGITLLEAMACGLPVLASDRGAIPEVVGTDTGKILSAVEVEQWVTAIRLLKENDHLRRKMGMNAHHRIVRNYSWDKCASRLMDAVTTEKSRRGGDVTPMRHAPH